MEPTRQFGSLYHGTSEVFKPGDIIKPMGAQRHAFAETRPDIANLYARTRAGQQGTLFGMVYHVEPTANDVKPSEMHQTAYTSEKGFRVKGLAGYSIPEDSKSYWDKKLGG